MPSLATLRKVMGLTAADRSEEDKKALRDYTGNPIPEERKATATEEGPLVLEEKPKTVSAEALRAGIEEAEATKTKGDKLLGLPESVGQSMTPFEQEQFARHATESIRAYNEQLARFKDKYGTNRESVNESAIDFINGVASENSSYFKRYRNTDKLPLSNDDYKKFAAEYEANKERYGEDFANQQLDSSFKDIVASNQSWWEQAGNALGHLESSIEGGLVEFVGNVYGIVEGLIDEATNPELSNSSPLAPAARVLDRAIDNPITRLGRDIEHAGASYPVQALAHVLWGAETADERIQNTKDTATKYNPNGIGVDAIVTSSDQDASVWSSATPWQALQSGGFTALSMLIGAGEAKAAQWIFGKMAQGAFSLHKTGRLIKTAEGLERVNEALKKGQNIANAYVIPGLVGANEGAVEGLETKINTQQEGERLLNESFGKMVSEEALALYNSDEENPLIEVRTAHGKTLQRKFSMDQAYKIAWDRHKDEYMQVKQQIDWASSMAGVQNFWMNSLINGMLNQTLKAGLQAPKVQEAIRNSRLFGWAYRKPSLSVNPTTNTATAVPPNIWRRGLSLVKEPAGEFLEESLQNISDATASAGAKSNITSFIDNKLNGDGQVKVGDTFSEDSAAAFAAFTGNLLDKETLKAGVLGGLGSVMGTVSTPGRGYHRNENGELVRNRSYFSIQNLQRGLNAQGEQESVKEYIARITPWRSGLANAYYDAKREKKDSQEMAAAVTRWLQKPENRAKWDGLAGTANWMTQMEKAAESNDQFAFRNSQQGKLINDVIMLQHLKGTSFYDAMMADIQRVSTLDINTEQGQQTIETMRKKGGEEYEGKSDEEIAQKLRDNAVKMLSTMSQISQEGDRLDGLLGRIDDDTKQSLIFDRIMRDNFIKRRDQLTSEINQLKDKIKLQGRTGSEKAINLTEEQKTLILQYGSLENARKERQKIENEKAKIEQRNKGLKSINKKDRTEEQLKEITNNERKIKYADKVCKQFDALYQRDEKGKIVKDDAGKPLLVEDTDVVFTAEDIMNMDPVTRAYVLQRGSAKFYNATHQNKQKIDKLTLELQRLQRQKEEAEEKKKSITDSNGRAKKHKNKQAIKINSQIEQLQKEINKKEKEIDKEKNRHRTERIYSETQQDIIDELVNHGTQADPDFLDKVIDIGRLQNAIDRGYKEYQEVLTNPAGFQQYVAKAKYRAKRDLLRRRTERIANIEDFSEYSQELDALLASVSQDEKRYIYSVLAIADEKKLKDKRATETENAVSNGDTEGIEANSKTIINAQEESEKTAVSEMPVAKTNFQKYQENLSNVQRLSRQFMRFPNLTDNDLSLLIDAMQYLLGKGVNLTDRDRVVETLLTPDDAGLAGGDFRNYVESKNVERDPATTTTMPRSTFTSIGQIIGDYVNLLASDEADLQYKKDINPVVKAESQIPISPAPVTTPTPTDTETITPVNPQEDSKERRAPGIFGVLGENSPESMQITDADGTVATEGQAVRANIEEAETTLGSAFSDVASFDVVTQIDRIDRLIEGSKISPEGKAIARHALESIIEEKRQSGETIATIEDLLSELFDKRNTLRRQAQQQEDEDNPYNQAANLFITLYGKTASSKAVENRKRAAMGSGSGRHINTRSSMIQSMNIEGTRAAARGKTRPWPVRFYDSYGIDDFHRAHTIAPTVPVYFITNSEWSAEVNSEMAEEGKTYSSLNDMPVVAVVLVENPTEEDLQTSIEINGLYYQPIAVMPSSSAEISGAEWVRELRKNASMESGVHFVTEKSLPSSKPITTTVYGKNYRVGHHRDAASQTKRDNTKKNDTNIIDDILNLLPEDEKARLEAMPREEMIEDPIYKKARNQRIDMLEWDNNEQSPTFQHIILRPNRMRGNGNEKAQGMIVMPVSFEASKSRLAGLPLSEVLQDGDAAAVRSFNSRTQRLFDEVLRPMFQFLPMQDKSIGDRSALCVTGQTLKENPDETALSLAKKEAERLTVWLNGYDKSDESSKNIPGVKRFIYVNPKIYKFKVVYNENDSSNVVGNDINSSTTKYEIYLIDSESGSVYSHLSTIDAGKNNTEQAAAFIRNLLYDNHTGSFRDDMKWQLSGREFKNGRLVDDKSKREYASLIDDGILTFAGSRSSYNITGILFRSPSGIKLPETTSDTVANGDNASQESPTASAPQAEGAVATPIGEQIEPDSGIQVDETTGNRTTEKVEKEQHSVPKPKESMAYKKAKAIVEKIETDSKSFTLSEDGRYYYATDKNTGERTLYARVTSVIGADETAEVYYPPVTDIIKHLGKEGVLTAEQIRSIKDIRTLSQKLQISVSQINRAIAELRTEHQKTAYGAWSLPSSAIGTSIDMITRDFFAGELKEDYPNVNTADLKKFVDQLTLFKDSLDAAGIHIIPNNIIAHGMLTIMDKDGKQHSVSVAGTLDLLGYDDYGNFYIFDMKTVRNRTQNKLQWSRSKWSRQLSLYADLLNQSYGISINKKNLRIIAINVDYPTPRGSDRYLDPNGPVYSVQKDHQLVVTDRRGQSSDFRAAQPTLQRTDADQFQTGYTELNLNWNSLTSADQDIADGIYQEMSKAEEQPAEPKEVYVEKRETEAETIMSKDAKIMDIIDDRMATTAPPITQNGQDYPMASWQELSKEALLYLKDAWEIPDESMYNLIISNPVDAEALRQDLKCKGYI